VVWVDRRDPHGDVIELDRAGWAATAELEVFDRLDVRASPFVYVVSPSGFVLNRGLVNCIEEVGLMIDECRTADGGLSPRQGARRKLDVGAAVTRAETAPSRPQPEVLEPTSTSSEQGH